MLVFTTEEKTDLKNFMTARQSFQDFKNELAVDEQQMLASLDFERKIWWLFLNKCTCEYYFYFRNSYQFSPRDEVKFVQLNLGLGQKTIGDEIKSCLELVNLPIYVRIGYC